MVHAVEAAVWAAKFGRWVEAVVHLELPIPTTAYNIANPHETNHFEITLFYKNMSRKPVETEQ